MKAFRCGEFDACIARAEASLGVPAKKREKYARREDAIIHALELEQQLEMRTQNPRNSFSHTRESNNLSLDIHNPVNDPRARMRGLQDFGLRIAPPKKKHTQYIAWGEASGNLVDYYLDPPSSLGPTNADACHSESSRSKRKRLDGGSCEDSQVKKNVLKNSVKLPTSHSFQSEYGTGGKELAEEKGNMGSSYDSLGNNYGYPIQEVPAVSNDYSGHMAEEHSSSETAEETVSDSSATDYLEHDIKEDGSLTDTTQSLMADSIHSESPHFRAPPKFKDPMYVELPIPDAGVSDWHIKGKRKIRDLPKKPSDFTKDTIFSDSFRRNSIKLRRMLSVHRQGSIYDNYSPSSDDGLLSYSDMAPTLIDVVVEVQKQSHTGEHVPWVSLSSKGNRGKPILGHPIQVEVLEEGSASTIVSEYGFYDVPPPVPVSGVFSRTTKRSTTTHRTATRSTMDDDGDPLYSDQEEKPRARKIAASHYRRSSKKKTRALSSFGNEKKHSRRSNSNVLDGLIKADDRMPLVTCVPVKVVFSRILESVGRTSLISAHRRGLL